MKVEWRLKDGDHVSSKTVVGTIQGSARSLLMAERVALNFVQRMSGIATATAEMTSAVKVLLERLNQALGIWLPELVS